MIRAVQEGEALTRFDHDSAVASFEAVGFNAAPAATATQHDTGFTPYALIPKAKALNASATAFYK